MFTKRGDYYAQSTEDPRYTIAAVFIHGEMGYESFFVEKISDRHYRTHWLGRFPDSTSAKKAAQEHKNGSATTTERERLSARPDESGE